MLLKVLTAIYFQTWCNMQFQSLTTMLKDHWWARFGKLLYELIGVYGMTFPQENAEVALCDTPSNIPNSLSSSNGRKNTCVERPTKRVRHDYSGPPGGP
jgi:hypothetical protein